MLNTVYKMQLGDKKFNHWLLGYYAWMSCLGVLLFAFSFLIAQCRISGTLQLFIGISLLPPLQKYIPYASSLVLYALRIGILAGSLLIMMV